MSINSGKISVGVTAGISCKGNIQALCLCLASIATGARVPQFVQVRLEGEFPGLWNFYLAQLSDLLLLNGVTTSFTVVQSEGVRKSRDWQFDFCKTPYLWMLDDDVIAHSKCLDALLYHLAQIEESENLSFLAGSKCDVNNRRKYPYFSMEPQGKDAVTPLSNHSLIYDVVDCWNSRQPTSALDTGNCFFLVEPIRKKNCKFHNKDEHRNSSGDGTAFWLQLAKKGLKGWFIPSACAYHLEKPGGGFNEFEARGEMLLRLCELEGYSKEELKRYWMPKTW